MAFLGDEGKDVAGARAAGMTAVLLDRTGNMPDAGEDLRISNLMDFFTILDQK